MLRRNRIFLTAINLLATIQFVWCYLWLTRPYVNTALYSQGRERMPFQGRCLMMPAMRWAHQSTTLQWLTRPFILSRFWFPKAVQPEVLVQAGIDVLCIAVTGWITVKLYQASSRRNLLTPFIYPLLLAVCGATYVMHTVQNFRFIYDLPSLAFFSVALYLLYFRLHWAWFAALFVVATINRETTLLLLPMYLINEAFDGRRFEETWFDWTRVLRLRPLLLVLCLSVVWVSWEIFIRQVFRNNVSEFYPRFNWNVKSLLAPLAWPQLLSACGYLLIGIIVLRQRISDPRLRAWLWIVPVWILFMFSYGILIETRVFGELISFVVCASALIAEETILLRLQRPRSSTVTSIREHPANRIARVNRPAALGGVAYSVHRKNHEAAI